MRYAKIEHVDSKNSCSQSYTRNWSLVVLAIALCLKSRDRWKFWFGPRGRMQKGDFEKKKKGLPIFFFLKWNDICGTKRKLVVFARLLNKLLEPRVYWKTCLFFKVGVRFVYTILPKSHLWNYTGLIVVVYSSDKSSKRRKM